MKWFLIGLLAGSAYIPALAALKETNDNRRAVHVLQAKLDIAEEHLDAIDHHGHVIFAGQVDIDRALIYRLDRLEDREKEPTP